MEIVFWCASETSPSPPPPSNPPFRPAHSVTPYGSAPCAEVAAIEGRVDVRDISAVSNCGDLMNRPWYTRAHCDNFYKSKNDGSYILCRLGTSSETEPDCVGWDTVACSPPPRSPPPSPRRRRRAPPPTSPPPSAPMKYTILGLGAGTCEQNGLINIWTTEDCEAAATALGLFDQTVCATCPIADNEDYAFKGCYQAKNSFALFNVNYANAHTGASQAVIDANRFLCKEFVSPSPPPTPPPPTPPPPSPPPPSPSPPPPATPVAPGRPPSPPPLPPHDGAALQPEGEGASCPSTEYVQPIGSALECLSEAGTTAYSFSGIQSTDNCLFPSGCFFILDAASSGTLYFNSCPAESASAEGTASLVCKIWHAPPPPSLPPPPPPEEPPPPPPPLFNVQRRGLILSEGITSSCLQHFDSKVSWVYDYGHRIKSVDAKNWINANQAEFVPMVHGFRVDSQHARDRTRAAS